MYFDSPIVQTFFMNYPNDCPEIRTYYDLEFSLNGAHEEVEEVKDIIVSIFFCLYR